MGDTVTLFRPVGTAELSLIERSNWRAFPPRLPEQPIFYPVTNRDYACQIAKDWNFRHNDDGKGYVTRFHVRRDEADRYERRVVGAREHEELWVPAEDLDRFNRAIVGKIEITDRFGGE